uniref:Uncharacterized protein n=1 Tax=Saimiri boliviensis boliviensis TaxID=39432 RepID=A0A2K6UZ10_SAIBB
MGLGNGGEGVVCVVDLTCQELESGEWRMSWKNKLLSLTSYTLYFTLSFLFCPKAVSDLLCLTLVAFTPASPLLPWHRPCPLSSAGACSP